MTEEEGVQGAFFVRRLHLVAFTQLNETSTGHVYHI